MAFNIDQFNAEISSKGTARQSNFDFYITLPNDLLNSTGNPQLQAHAAMGGGGIGYSLSLRCESFDFPGRGLQAIDGHRSMGFETPVNIPYAPVHLEVNGTFICSRELEEKEIFERWQDLIVGDYRRVSPQDTMNQFNPGYYDEVVKPCMIRLRQFDDLGAVMYEIELREVYPRTINPLQASWANGAEVHKLNVSFNYRHHIIKTEPIGIKESERVFESMAAAENLAPSTGLTPPPGQNFKFTPF